MRRVPLGAGGATPVRSTDAAPDEDLSLVAAERAHIQRVLAVAGSRTRAARLLKISRSTLWEKMRRLGLRE